MNEISRGPFFWYSREQLLDQSRIKCRNSRVRIRESIFVEENEARNNGIHKTAGMTWRERILKSGDMEGISIFLGSTLQNSV